MKPIRLGVIMDPIADIHYQKDSTLAMLWEAQARGWDIFYMEQNDVFLQDGIAYTEATALAVMQDPQQWFKFNERKTMPLSELNIILMRKDPPFNQAYIYTTQLLDYAERSGVLVVNNPQALRDFNEKIFAACFPECAPPTLVTACKEKLNHFLKQHKDIVCKPLDSMGGVSIFRLQNGDVNAPVIFETLTHNQSLPIMAQRFIPEITAGDKRILLINGEAIPHALARVPQGEDWRGNLAVGAKGLVQPLTERDQFICAQVGPMLRNHGLYFVGIDVIGDYLTEINVTSPTGIRELDTHLKINISAMLFDVLEKELQ